MFSVNPEQMIEFLLFLKNRHKEKIQPKPKIFWNWLCLIWKNTAKFYRSLKMA